MTLPAPSVLGLSRRYTVYPRSSEFPLCYAIFSLVSVKVMVTAYVLVYINILCNTGALPKILFRLTFRVLRLAPLSGRLQDPLECLSGGLVCVLGVGVPADDLAECVVL